LAFGTTLQAELLFAAVAHPDAAGLDERILLGAAARAGNTAIWSAKIERVSERTISVREGDDGGLKGARRRFDMHVK